LSNPAVAAAVPFVNGGVSGMIATSIIQPIDMVKVRICCLTYWSQLGGGLAAANTLIRQVRLQLAGEGLAQGARPSPLTITRDIISQGRFLDLYSGLSAGILRQAVYVAQLLVA
jgi:hypothetical protein